MKLIRKTRITITKNGCEIQWAVFWCNGCSQEVEKSLSNGKNAKSCGSIGCKENKGINNPNYKHGENYTKLHMIWDGMKQRILNVKNKEFKNYGGRGITICPEWTNDYTKFRDWSLSNGYVEGLQIDRINNNENYTQSDLAKKYKINKSQISKIIDNKSWKK